ncbi:MAG: glycosyltransferase [Candidatus Rokubacteria bacterium]|nr:glycosyltransferase [Candidatus Rokubacteria bacterium]
MTILTFNWSEPFLHLLAKTGHQLVVCDWMRPWNPAHRPVAANIRRVSSEADARQLLADGRVDYGLALRVDDLLWLGEERTPTFFVARHPLRDQVVDGTAWAAGRIRDLVATRLGTHGRFVTTSPLVHQSWGLDGPVIPPGLDLADYGGYTGHVPSVLSVGDPDDERDSMPGLEFLNSVLSNFYWTVIRVTRFLHHRDGEVWEDLKADYRRHRLFAFAPLDPDADGYGLPLLEAMATGMPVVTTPHPTSPVREGIDGFVGEDQESFARWTTRLLSDPALAHRLGEQARRRVAELFPLQAFCEQWEQALSHCGGDARVKRLHPAVDALPDQGRTPAMSETRRRVVHLRRRPERLKILVSVGNHPTLPSAYYARALRTRHDVLTSGPPLDDERLASTRQDLELRNPFRSKESVGEAMELLRRLRRAPDIPILEKHPPITDLLDRLPRNWRPDLFIWFDDDVRDFMPQGVERLDCPTACVISDFHIEGRFRLDRARAFDHVFVMYDRRHVRYFAEAGCRSVHWLPTACDPAIHRGFDVEKAFDIVFIGQTRPSNNPDRFRLLTRLMRGGFDVFVTTKYLEDATLAFSRARIVFNCSLVGGLIQRVFEACASGSLLLTNRLAPETGLDELLQDRVHLVCYDDHNLDALAQYYLEHPDEREAIAREGQREVLARHTYAHRVESLLTAVFRPAATVLPPVPTRGAVLVPVNAP